MIHVAHNRHLFQKFFFVLAACFVASFLAAEPIVVVAGSASKPVLEEAAQIYEARGLGTITLMLGGSGELLSKVRLTGVGDLYLPGSHDFMEKAKSLGFIATGSEKVFAYLVPALCVPASNPKMIQRLEDLASPGVRVGIGHPETVCVGLYAVEILEKTGLAKQTKPNIVTYFDSCAKVATAVAIGSVDVALGWREFGFWAPKDITVIPLLSDQVLRIATLPGGLLTTSKQKEAAIKFLDFLASPEGKTIYRKWGYLTEEAEVKALAPSATIGGLFSLPDGWK